MAPKGTIYVGGKFDGTKWKPTVEYRPYRGPYHSGFDNGRSSSREFPRGNEGGNFGGEAPGPVAAVVGILMFIGIIIDARSSPPDPGRVVTPQNIQEERTRREMDSNAFHMVICGSSGSGKSSLINALMGIANGTEGAAATGQRETTTHMRSYFQNAHSTVMYDCPGAGTAQAPGRNYFYHQMLYIFDYIVVVHSGRFTEIDIAVLKACRRHEKKAIVVCSKSDVAIRAVADDNNLDISRARERYVASAITDVRRQLEANGLENLPFYLVNNRDLRHAVLGQDFTEFWSHETQLLEILTEESGAGRVRAVDEGAADDGIEYEVEYEVEHEVEHEEQVDEIDAAGYEGGRNGAETDAEMEQLVQYGDESGDEEIEGE